MATNLRTHLMFDGDAEEAMRFYISLFPDSRVDFAQRYAEGEHEGKLQQGVFSLAGREFVCIDSPVRHDFGFTPAISLFVDCESMTETGRVYNALAEGGEILMPLDNYGFSEQFGWVKDRFGVSWQINLPASG